MIVEFDREVVASAREIAGGIAGGGDGEHVLAVGQSRHRVAPGAVGADRCGAGEAVDVDDHRVAGVGGSGQRGRSPVEVGGVEVKLAVAALGHRRVGDCALADRQLDREVVASAREIAGGVAGGGDGEHVLAVGQSRHRVAPGAVGADRRIAGEAVDVDDHRVAGVGGSGQGGRSAVEVGGVEIKLAVAALGHRRVGNRALGDRQLDREVVASAREIAGGIADGGDGEHVLAVGQSRHRVAPGAIGADCRIAGEAVDVDDHRIAGVGGSGQRGRSAVEVGRVEVEMAVAALGHRGVGNRALGDRRIRP